MSILEFSTESLWVPPNLCDLPEWGNAMGERMQWMVNNKIQSAEIRLDPPELGSVEVKIVIQKDTAQVNFVTHHAQVKDAVEHAMPRLREMFGETGLSLGDVNVSQESFKQHADIQCDGRMGQGHVFASLVVAGAAPRSSQDRRKGDASLGVLPGQ